MRRICLTLAVVFFVTSMAQAQRQRQPRQGGGRGGFPMTPLQLLSNKSVQEELKVNDEQKKKIEDAAKANREEREKLMKDANLTFRDFRNPDKREEFAKINKKLSESTDKALANVLTTDQSKRFKQIRVQDMGTRAFSNEEVQKDLKMTEDQQKKIKEINEELAKERTEIFKDVGMDREKFAEAQKKLDEKRKEAEGKIAATLSAEQKKAFTDLKGEKFEIKREQPRRPGGGGTTPRRPRTDLD